MLGFGASAKPATPYTIKLWVDQIHEFWQTFVGVPTVLVGNSIGSLTCLQAAATYPEMVRGVAMISLPDMSESPNKKLNILRFLQDKILDVLTSPIVLKPLFYLLRQPYIVKRWARLAYACKEAVTEELLEILMTPAREIGAAPAFCAILKSMMSKGFSPCIRSIVTDLKLPSLLMWGTLDRMIPLSLAHSLLKLNPQLRLVELENAGHCAHDECPERVNFELLDWIRSQVLVPAV
ncbi:alpha/beta hydrolase fold protein [Calothrix sp. NIES-4071]|nr:alpha/beta hydrolase fold protein [Calothrix sp. NIES-4071]BAZ63166.1 alpha/beta hydrolase fold protein [Calothrix sp. NIES-4105]